MADLRLVAGVLTYLLVLDAVTFGMADLVHATLNFFSPQGALVYGFGVALLTATLTALFRMLEMHPHSVGLTRTLRAAPEFTLGGVLGAAAYTVVVGVQWALGFVVVEGLQTDGGAVRLFVASLARNPGNAFAEELAYRGQVLNRLAERVGFKVAAVVSSLLYAGSHFRVSGFGPAAFVGLTLLGLLLAFLRRRTGSLWVPIGFHAAWNIVQGGVFGLSMLDRSRHGMGLIAVEQRGPVPLVGAGILTEGGLVIIAVLAASTILCAVGMRAGRSSPGERSNAAEEAG